MTRHADEWSLWAVIAVFGLSVLLAGTLLKLANLAASIWWALRYGSKYARDHKKRRPKTLCDRIELIRKHHGDFFPFGAKSLKLYAFDGRPRLDKTVGRMYRGTLFFLAWAALALVVVLGLGATDHWIPQLTVTLAILVDLYTMGLLAEAISWYLMTDDYAVVWGGVKSSGFTALLEEHEPRFRDVVTLGGLATLSGVAVTVSVAVAQYFFGSFGGLGPGSTTFDRLGLVVSSANYVASNVTTIGSVDMTPHGLVGQGIALITSSLTILVITLLASILGARVQASGDSGAGA